MILGKKKAPPYPNKQIYLNGITDGIINFSDKQQNSKTASKINDEM